MRRSVHRIPVVLATAAFALAGCPSGGVKPTTLPAADQIVKTTSGIVASNVGRMVGKVKNGPVGLIAQQGAAMRLQAVDDLVAVSGARVEVLDAEGQVVSQGSATTDAEGNFTIRRFKASPAVVYVRAEYAAGDQAVVLRCVAPAPRKAGAVEATVDPAASLVAKKILAMVRAKVVGPTAIDAGVAEKMSRAVAAALDPAAMAAGALADDAEGARAFDALLDRNAGLEDKLRAIAGTGAMGKVLEPTPEGANGGPGNRPPLALRPPTANLATAGKDAVLLAGAGQAGFADGPSATAKFNVPYDIATDPQGNAYVADSDNHRIRKIAPDGTVSTVAGNGEPGWVDGPGDQAKFSACSGVSVAPDGSLYVADYGNHRIRKVSFGADGKATVSTVAGNSAPGFADGVGALARFSAPADLTVDPSGVVFVADTDNNRIRKITADGTVTTVAGVGVPGLADGDALTAQLSGPSDVAVDSRGRLFVADTDNHAVRMVADGRLTTMAGTGVAGYADGTGKAARFNTPYGIAVGPGGVLYVADSANHSIRMVNQGGGVSTWWGAAGPQSDPPQGLFNGPSGVAIRPGADGTPEVYVADSGLHVLRKFALAKPAAGGGPADLDGLAPK